MKFLIYLVYIAMACAVVLAIRSAFLGWREYTGTSPWPRVGIMLRCVWNLMVAACIIAVPVIQALWPDDLKYQQGQPLSMYSWALFLVATIGGVAFMASSYADQKSKSAERKKTDRANAAEKRHKAKLEKLEQERIDVEKERLAAEDKRAKHIDKIAPIIGSALPAMVDIGRAIGETTAVSSPRKRTVRRSTEEALDDLAYLAGALLHNACQIVKIYDSNDSVIDALGTDGYGLNASLWLELSSNGVSINDLGEGAMFLDGERYPEDYPRLLKLKRYATAYKCVDAEFTLPINKEPKLILPGAPLAMTGQASVINNIDDTTEIEYIVKDLPSELVKQAVRDHFGHRTHYKTVMSLPLNIGDRTRGVMNVQSLKSGIFIMGGKPNSELIMYLLPICGMLAQVANRWVELKEAKA